MSDSLNEKIEGLKSQLLELRDKEKKYFEGEIYFIVQLKEAYNSFVRINIILDELMKYKTPNPNYFQIVEEILDEILIKLQDLYKRIEA